MDDDDIEVEVPRLDGTPYRFHTYIAFCPADAAKYRKVCKELTKYNFFIYHEDERLSDQKNIEIGIDRSRKVLILVTKTYLTYPWRTHQINIAKEKADYISQDDIVILRWEGVTNDDLKDLKLPVGEYRDVVYDESCFCVLASLLAGESMQTPEVRSNMGSAMAYSYFYGYLRIILPGMAERIKGSGYMKGLKNPNQRNIPKKFFIIVPESLHGPPSLDHMDERITDLGKITYKAGRGGNPERDFSSFVHQIDAKRSDDVHQIDAKRSDDEVLGEKELEHFLFLGEVPNILINLCDMENCNVLVDKRRKNLEVRQFFYYLQHLLSRDPECMGQVAFIYHADEDTRNYQQIGDLILEKIKDEILADIAEEMNPAAPTDYDERDASTSKAGFQTVGVVKNQDFKVEYLSRPLQFYPMDQDPVGHALVINNRSFDKLSSFPPRRGTECDEDAVLELLEWLNFKTTPCQDLTAAAMMEQINNFSDKGKHIDMQAFICVIMTHGDCGQLYGIDGQPVNFVEIAEILSKCRTLKGKPKIFFIEACQTREKIDPDSLQSESTVFNRSGSESEFKESLTPCAADFLASFSTLPGKTAFRDAKKGTLYIQALCKLIREKAMGMDLEQILKMVATEVRGEIERRDPESARNLTPAQLPFFVSTMDRRIAMKR